MTRPPDHVRPAHEPGAAPIPLRAPRIAVVCTALVLAAAAGAASAQLAAPHPAQSITVHAGGRSGGDFTDSVTGASVKTDASAAFAISWERTIDASRQVQLLLSHQDSQLTFGPSGTTPPAVPAPVPIRVTHLHLGGLNFFNGPVGRGPYVSGGLGVSIFHPGLDGLSTEFRPSASLGIGWQAPIGRAAALRLELRGYAALVSSDGGFFCSGGCVVSIRGDVFTQAEALIGLSIGF